MSESPLEPLVTVCIPTWQGQDFIGRALDCARHQTLMDIRILVSVDRCDDDTAAICPQIPFPLQLLAAGPALHVPRALYKYWFRREGGVTDA